MFLSSWYLVTPLWLGELFDPSPEKRDTIEIIQVRIVERTGTVHCGLQLYEIDAFDS